MPRLIIKASPSSKAVTANGRDAVSADPQGLAGRSEIDLDFLPATIGYFLRRLQEAYKGHFLTSTPGLDLAPKDVAALFIVARNPGVSPTQFSDAMAIDGAMASLLLAALERRGLIKREKSVADGRSRIISLTKDGTALIAKLRRTVTSVDSQFTAGLSESERAQLLGLLARLWTSRASESVARNAGQN